MYSAAVHGSLSTMTVAVFDGENAEERWMEAISIYSYLRHPNVLQLFGTTTSTDYYTAIFHDDLVSAHKLLLESSESALWKFYFQHFLRDGFRDAASYISSALGGRWVSSEECTIWIRASTGKICVELTPGCQVLSRQYYIERRVYQHEDMFNDSVKLRVADMITSTSFLQYFGAFCEDQPTTTLSELPASASLGSILDLGPSGTSPGTVIASIPAQAAQRWRYQHWYYGAEEEIDWTWDEILNHSVVDDQWACINSGSVAETYYYNGDLEPEGMRSWLAQANHVFNQSNISDSLERFGLVVRITITLMLEGNITGLLPGFLFLYCPSPRHSTPAKSQDSSSIAYWSLDRTGRWRLSPEDARSLGFPAIKADVGVHVKSWDSTVYLFLRQFHEGKGFDPDSEDVARHLGLAPVSLSVAPLKIVQLPAIDETWYGDSADCGRTRATKNAGVTHLRSPVCEDTHVEGTEFGEVSAMLPRGMGFVMSLKYGLIAASALLAVFYYLWG
ncbi:hypothetical protein B0H13DRAFT_2026042 [Mycena leptocephala]|nr:hypothetical protein B0H13DRAFT_2026042 [Mycena leptocephala]